MDSNITPVPVLNFENMPCFIPYNLMTQHSIPDKSLADCVEALIGAYLIACGPRGALLFMSWLGINVLPKKQMVFDKLPSVRTVGSTKPQARVNSQGIEVWTQVGESVHHVFSLDLVHDSYTVI
jgi:endoribonuclease Dicer